MNLPLRTIAGSIDNPNEVFDAQKLEMMKAVEGLLDMKLTLNRILLAIWVRPEKRDLGGGKSIIMPDKVRDEDVYQGCAGLVIMKGPQAFISDENVKFDVVPQIGDWVLFKRQAAGMRMRHNGIDCIILEEERPIKAILSRPDYVE